MMCAVSSRFTPTCVGTAASVNGMAHGLTGSPPRAWGRPLTILGIGIPPRFTPTCVGTARGSPYIAHRLSVHPHVRGDGPQTGLDSLIPRGSPPRAWGRRLGLDNDGRGFWFTPTCVGTALSGDTPMRSSPGSPPRAWGRRIQPVKGFQRVRFTPTCVGTAPARREMASYSPVHPHVRGDGYVGFMHEIERFGSPPRAWGRRASENKRHNDSRFTPTCVGTAIPDLRRRLSETVHPHVRGDGMGAGGFAFLSVGSPPRAWGRPVGIDALHRHHRFTPTCVGTAIVAHGGYRSTRFTPTCVGTAVGDPHRFLLSPVHPHVRGDGDLQPCSRPPFVGSPPRAWGRRPLGSVNVTISRFTPTCVGTASTSSSSRHRPAVHPHVRGDGRWRRVFGTGPPGSPPRAWGRLSYSG